MRLAVMVLAAIGFSATIADSGPLPVHTLNFNGVNNFRLLESSSAGMTFEVTVGELAGLDVQTGGGVFTELSLPGFHSSRSIGEPALPLMNRLCEVPYGAAVTASVLEREVTVVRLADHGIVHPLMPAQPSVPKNRDPASLPFHYNADSYVPGRIVALEPASYHAVGELRGARFGRLEVAPVSYDPGAGEITVCTRLRVRLDFPGADPARTATEKAAVYSPFFDIVQRRLAGHRTPHDEHPDLMNRPVAYVIVSDRMFEDALRPFIAWQTDRGFRMIAAYTDVIGSTTQAIQSYLHDLYAHHSPSPTFVLFVGDVEQVPAFITTGPSDLPYCDVNGDNIPEMYYGRFSARNVAELIPQLEKTFEYEWATFPDPAYLGEAVMVAGYDEYYGPSHSNGQINYGTRHYFNAEHGILSHTYLCPESQQSGPQIFQNISDGAGFVNYTAHGTYDGWLDPALFNAHLNYLQNEHEYSVVLGNCCETSRFDSLDCFAEHWLRLDRKGAVGYIGAADISEWYEDYWWAVGAGPIVPSGADYEETGLGAYDGLWHDHDEPIDQWYVVQDALVFCGNLAVTEAGGLYDYYWWIYNLMGDPSLSPYMGIPSGNDVSTDPYVPIQEGTWPPLFRVEAEPNSYVGLTKNGHVVGSGMIGPSGVGTIPVTGHGTSGFVHLVVTCQNKYPFIAEVPIRDPSGCVGDPRTPRLVLRIGPNPARASARITLDLERDRRVSLRIHDISGRVVKTFVNGWLPSGRYDYAWTGVDNGGRLMPSGVYVARMRSESSELMQKLLWER